MRAIRTKYIGPTNCRGSRIKADDGVSSITISYDHSCSTEQAHWKAAQALAKRYGWSGTMIGGGLDDCNVFVFEQSERHEI